MRAGLFRAIVVSSLLVGASAWAQQVRPGAEAPAVPEPIESPEPERLRLPPIPEMPRAERRELAARVRVEAFRFRGNSAVATAELERTAAPYAGRDLYAEDLEELREALTAGYVSKGFVTSFATIPPQQPEEGVVEVRLVEAGLGKIVVEGTERLYPGYVERRLQPDPGDPVNVFEIERELELLQQGDLIERVHAQLVPVSGRREFDLLVSVTEEPPLELTLGLANDRSPAVGENAAQAWAEHRDLLGFGDRLSLGLEGGEGFVDADARYAVPITSADTTLELYAARQRSKVVESPFDEIDIESESSTLGVGLRQPLWRDARQQVWMGLLGELRRGETSILGERFSFVPAADDGVTKVSVLRLLFDWTRRGTDQALAFRSTWSQGLDVLGASEYGSHLPGSHVADGEFGAWLSQLHWLRRLPPVARGSELVARLDAQLARDPLLPLEQFAIGGSRTVRGYPESALVRDNGIAGSLELRVPVLRGPLGEDRLQLASFVDVGRAWNESKTSGPKTLASVGLGARWRATRRVFFSAYWGARLRDVDDPSDGLQRSGLHIEATTALF